MRFRRSISILILAFLPLACGGGNGDGATEEGPDAVAEAGGSEADRAAGAEVAERAIEAWTENAEGVAGYTAVEETGGNERTVTYDKVVVNGLPTFRPESAGAADSAAAPTMMALLREARHAGSGEVEGEETEILVIDDPAVLEESMGGQMQGALAPSRLEIHVDSEGFPRRMRMEGTATLPNGESHPITTEMTMTDWRTVDGFRHPFRRTTRLEGMGALAEAAASHATAEMEQRMEGMPEAQREQARAMIRQRMQQMAAAEETVTVTKSLEVRPE